MSKLYVVVDTDISKREMTRLGNNFLAIRIFTDEKKQRAGHHWDIDVINDNGKKTLSYNGQVIDMVEYQEKDEEDEVRDKDSEEESA